MCGSQMAEGSWEHTWGEKSNTSSRIRSYAEPLSERAGTETLPISGCSGLGPAPKTISFPLVPFGESVCAYSCSKKNQKKGFFVTSDSHTFCECAQGFLNMMQELRWGNSLYKILPETKELSFPFFLFPTQRSELIFPIHRLPPPPQKKKEGGGDCIH